MDIQDIWQEHKRWILGVLAGVILFFVGRSIVEGVYGAQVEEAKVQGVLRSVRGQEYFGGSERQTIDAEGERLQALEQRIRSAVEFQPDEEFVLAGKGDPDTYFVEIDRRVREQILGTAQEYGVEVGERDLKWTPPVGREEIHRTMLGLCVLRHLALRLLQAGEEVRAAAPDAIGVQTIDSLTVESGAGKRRSTRRGRFRANRRSDEIADRIEESVVAFSFRCDYATLQRFFEKCRSMEPALTLLPDLKIKPGNQIGDPLIVQGRLCGLAVREALEES